MKLSSVIATAILLNQVASVPFAPSRPVPDPLDDAPLARRAAAPALAVNDRSKPRPIMRKRSSGSGGRNSQHTREAHSSSKSSDPESTTQATDDSGTETTTKTDISESTATAIADAASTTGTEQISFSGGEDSDDGNSEDSDDGNGKAPDTSSLDKQFEAFDEPPPSIDVRLSETNSGDDPTGNIFPDASSLLKTPTNAEVRYGSRAGYLASNELYAEDALGRELRLFSLLEGHDAGRLQSSNTHSTIAKRDSISDHQRAEANRTKALREYGKTWQEVLDDRDFNSQGKPHRYANERRRHSVLSSIPFVEIAIENLLRNDAIAWVQEKGGSTISRGSNIFSNDPPDMTPLSGPSVQDWTSPKYITENVEELAAPKSKRKVEDTPKTADDALDLWKQYRTVARRAVDPVVRKMVEGQDSVWYYEVALAVWQITRPNTALNGIFYHNMTGFDFQMSLDVDTWPLPEEDQKGLFALDAALMKLFYGNWAEAQKALDKTGIEKNWNALEKWLAPKDNTTVTDELKSFDKVDSTQQFLLDGLNKAAMMEDADHHTNSTQYMNTHRPKETPVPQHVTPHSDGQCKNKVGKWTFKSGGDETISNGYFAMKVQSNASLVGNNDARNIYKDITMEIGTDDKQGDTTGYSIWWGIDEIPDGCRYIIMKPYADWRYGIVGKAPGNVMVNAGGPGCYYSHFKVKEELDMTYCCGDDCGIYNVGYASMNSVGKQKRGREERDFHAEANHVTEELNERRAAASPLDKPIVSESTRRSASIDERTAAAIAASNNTPKKHLYKRGDSCAPDDKACFDKAFSECKMTPGKPYNAGGRQDMISGGQQHCDTGNPCNVEVSYTMTNSVELSSSHESSFTTTEGIEISFQGGTTFPVQATTTVTGSLSLAQSVSDSTGQSYGTSNASSVSHTMGVNPGGEALLTFTPSMQCYDVFMECPNSAKWTLHSCAPNLKDGNVVGEYLMVYIG